MEFDASDTDAPRYRRVIDELVRSCREGQGQISADRMRHGVWNPHSTTPENTERNEVLAALSEHQRRVLAVLLEEAFQSGVHETLVVLESNQIAPFDRAYVGTPYHDFMGRLDLDTWEWPDEPRTP